MHVADNAPGAGRAAAAALARFEAVAWPLLIGLGLVPVWAFTYYPSVDGPAHLALVHAWLHYDDPAMPVLREVFALNPRLVPNHFMHVALAGLMQVFDPLTAEKVLLSVYVTALPLALRYAARAFGPAAGVVGLLGVPMSHHALLAFGFYNTSFAIVFFLVTYGFWLRHADRGSWRALAGYVVLGVLCYLCHLSAVLMTVGAIALTTLGRSVAELVRRANRPAVREALRRFASRALLPALGLLPAIALALDYLLAGRRVTATVNHIANVAPPGDDRVLALLTGRFMVQHDLRETWAALAFVLGLAALAWLLAGPGGRGGGSRAAGGMLACALGFLAVYLVAPFQFHVRWMPTRLAPYVFLAAVLWLASLVPAADADVRRSVRRIVLGVTVFAMVTATAVRIDRFAAIDAYLREVVSLAAAMEPGAAVLALPLGRTLDGRPVSDRRYVAIQAGSLVALAADGIDLKNFQAHTGIVPIVFRPKRRPWTHLAADADFLARPLEVDVTRYRRRTGRPINYVLLFGDPAGFPAEPAGHPLTRGLAAEYELVQISAPRGLARLYRFVGAADAAAGGRP